jgi:hypothetical protein
MMKYSDFLQSTEWLLGFLSTLDTKLFLCEFKDVNTIVTVDIGPHCADPNCGERLTLTLLLGYRYASPILRRDCFNIGSITGINERLRRLYVERQGEQKENSVNSFLTRLVENLPNMVDIGRISRSVYHGYVGEDGRSILPPISDGRSGEESGEMHRD